MLFAFDIKCRSIVIVPFGINVLHAYDLERVHLLKELIDEGWADKILVCNDICLKTMWKTFGGLGYAHILRDVRSMAIENGIDAKVYDAILTDNVVNFIK